MKSRPRHADPTLWEWATSGKRWSYTVIMFDSWNEFPVVHRIKDGIHEDYRITYHTGCGRTAQSRQTLLTEIAAQACTPCRRCWPESDIAAVKVDLHTMRSPLPNEGQTDG